ncbi:hypothetical protein ACFXG4_23415 [Nocardia sp. NPDC059246]|uniref:hypothetical protein n=1 Tax=Nocardia sp. NPDC059246 TaxID=3346789 RepID=UPI00369895CD
MTKKRDEELIITTVKTLAVPNYGELTVGDMYLLLEGFPSNAQLTAHLNHDTNEVSFIATFMMEV